MFGYSVFNSIPIDMKEEQTSNAMVPAMKVVEIATKHDGFAWQDFSSDYLRNDCFFQKVSTRFSDG